MRYLRLDHIIGALVLLSGFGSAATDYSGNITKTSQSDKISEIIFLSNVTRPQSTTDGNYSDRTAAYRLLQTDWQLPEGTCSEKIPCANGACCSKVSRAIVFNKAVAQLTLFRHLDYVATPQRSVVLIVAPTAMQKQNVANTALQENKTAHWEFVAPSSGM